jgi:hypothetical protein
VVSSGGMVGMSRWNCSGFFRWDGWYVSVEMQWSLQVGFLVCLGGNAVVSSGGMVSMSQWNCSGLFRWNVSMFLFRSHDSMSPQNCCFFVMSQWSMHAEFWWNNNSRGNTRALEEHLPYTLRRKPTWNIVEANWGMPGKKSTTVCQRRGTKL